jgi:indolepyruvate decarboxylase
VAASSGSLTQVAYWNAMQKFIRPGDVIVAEDGTSIIGTGRMSLPEGCTFVPPAMWGSIGFATAALLGALLAAPDRRHVLFTGEGSSNSPRRRSRRSTFSARRAVLIAMAGRRGCCLANT